MTQAADDVRFFIELGKPLAKARTVKETLNIVMFQVGEIFEPENWSLLLKDSQKDEMVFSLVVGSQKSQLQGMRLPMNQGIVGHIMQTGKSVIVEDVSKSEQFTGMVDQAIGFQTQSIIGVPLKTGDKILGVIELINKLSGKQFTLRELTILEAIAEYAAIAIERSYYLHTLKSMAMLDPLTGLKNRLSFENTLKNSVAAFKRYGVHCTMLLVDVKQFRQINDTHGFSVGNTVLKTVGIALKTILRGVDDLFRFGGDKFIVLMPHTEREQAEQARQRILRHIASLPPVSRGVSVGLSIAVHSVDIENVTALQRLVEERFSKQPADTPPRQSQEMADGMESHLRDSLSATAAGESKSKALSDDIALKTGFRKSVSLSGDYRHGAGKAYGYIKVVDLSMQWVGFETMLSNSFQPNDMVDLSFSLDDQRRTQIKRRVMVRRVDGRYVEGEFYNPPPYDRHLGFYLMG